MESGTVDSPERAGAAPGGRVREAIFTFDDMTWAAAHRRGWCFPQDRLLLALLDDEELDRVLVCDRPRSAPVKLAKDLIERPLRFKSSFRSRLWQPLTLRRQDPPSVPALERTYARYDRRLRRAAERFGMERPALITAQPFVAAFAELSWAGPVTLYATDDLSSHGDYARWHESLRVAYRRVGERGRRVCAVSAAILDRIEPGGPARVVPNGVDPALWQRPAAPPAWWRRLSGPRLLYIGTLDSRLDIEAASAVARAWPEGSLVLVGPLADRAHLEPLLAEPNVVLRPPVEREEVAALAHAADACLLPHRRTPLTEAMSPLKLFEYLASGNPTVATDLEPIRRTEADIVRVPVGGDFVAGVATALKRGPVGEDERQALIAASSWAGRSASVLEIALEP